MSLSMSASARDTTCKLYFQSGLSKLSTYQTLLNSKSTHILWIFGGKTVFARTFYSMLNPLHFPTEFPNFYYLLHRHPYRPYYLLYSLMAYGHIVIIWPYVPHFHMATNMANMGVQRTSNRNVGILRENEADSSML